MKIVVKHTDTLNGSLIKNKQINQYLVYLMTDTNQPISCDFAYGEQAKDVKVRELLEAYDFTLGIYEVSYNDFKNNVLRNEAN